MRRNAARKLLWVALFLVTASAGATTPAEAKMIANAAERGNAGAHQGRPDLEKQARDGDAAAEYRLGMRYETGAHGLRQDDAKALQWLGRAAGHGDVQAMKALEDVYRKGLLGVKPDPDEVMYWRNRAEAAGMKVLPMPAE